MPSKSAQGPQVDVTFVPGVVAGNVPRQHSAVGSVNLLGHEGNAHARQLVHTEHFQNVDVAVTTADKNEILDDRSAVVHLPHGCRRGCPARALRTLKSKSTFPAKLASSGEGEDLCCAAVARVNGQRSRVHIRIDRDRSTERPLACASPVGR